MVILFHSIHLKIKLILLLLGRSRYNRRSFNPGLSIRNCRRLDSTRSFIHIIPAIPVCRQTGMAGLSNGVEEVIF